MQFGQWLANMATEYLHTQIIAEDKTALETCGQAIFAMEPHHVLPLGIVSLNDHTRGFTGHRSLGCITSACFKVPLMRHVYTWINAFSVDKKDLIGMLNQGISPVICPGGVQEVSYLENASDQTEWVLYLKKRTGFIKLAMKYGIPVIPVFTFGLQHTFSFWIPKHRLVTAIGRKLGVLPMMFFGLWNIPLGPAKPSDYVNVIGKPIEIPKNNEPTDEELKLYLQKYIDELTRIFEENKAIYGMEHMKIRIV
jgi:diacylglycerol O-acyltransferase 2, plant